MQLAEEIGMQFFSYEINTRSPAMAIVDAEEAHESKTADAQVMLNNFGVLHRSAEPLLGANTHVETLDEKLQVPDSKRVSWLQRMHLLR